jgi:hypothetical protein
MSIPILSKSQHYSYKPEVEMRRGMDIVVPAVRNRSVDRREMLSLCQYSNEKETVGEKMRLGMRKFAVLLLGSV